MAEQDYAAPIIETVAGEEVAFPRLLMKDYATLESQVRANRSQKVRALCDECKLSGRDRFDQLASVEGLDVNMAMVAAYVETHDGARKVFNVSLAKAGKTPEQIASVFEKYEVLEATNLASALVGFKRRVPLEGVVQSPLAQKPAE